MGAVGAVGGGGLLQVSGSGAGVEGGVLFGVRVLLGASSMVRSAFSGAGEEGERGRGTPLRSSPTAWTRPPHRHDHRTGSEHSSSWGPTFPCLLLRALSVLSAGAGAVSSRCSRAGAVEPGRLSASGVGRLPDPSFLPPAALPRVHRLPPGLLVSLPRPSSRGSPSLRSPPCRTLTSTNSCEASHFSVS